MRINNKKNKRINILLSPCFHESTLNTEHKQKAIDMFIS